MTDDADEIEAIRQEQEKQLTKLIVDDIREAWLRNTVIWVGVVGGSLAVVLGVLALVTGG